MWRAATLLLTLVAATAAPEVRVEVVLDASQGMWADVGADRPGFVAARMSLQAWVLERAADRDLALGLRLAGGRAPLFDEDGGCGGVELVIPPGPVDIAQWRTALDAVRPAGPRPLLLAVAAAAEDLGDGPDPRRIVLVISGEESCFGDEQAAIDALAAGVELRIVGVGLPESIVERLGAVAPVRNATSTAALLAALRWTVEELPSATPSDAPVRVRIDGLEEYTGASLVNTITTDRRDLSFRRGELGGEAPPGCYTIELAAGDGASTTRIDGAQVAAGTGLDLAVGLLPPPLPDFDVIPERPWSGGPIFVWFSGLGPGTFRVSVAPGGEPSSGWLDARTTPAPEALVELRAPDAQGPLEVRLDEEIGGGLSRAVARMAVEVVAPDAALEAPPEIRPFEPLPVTWSGPDNPGDSLSLVPAGGPSTNPAACWPTSWGSPALLVAPGEEGPWEVRYVSGVSGTTFASADVAVTSIIVTLDVPREVAAGRTFEVAWEGPADAADYLALATEDEPAGEYISLFLASQGNPARFDAPREPGAYEIRYIDGDDGRVLRRADLVVVETQVRLKAPRKVRVGTRFDVRWTGPDRPGDYLAVARPGDPPEHYEDWAYTSLGSPTSLAAPFEAGAYELRYITDWGSEILAAIPLNVQ